jgi:HEAT repeat protein
MVEVLLPLLAVLIFWIGCFLPSAAFAVEQDAAFFNAQIAGLSALAPFPRVQAAARLGQLKNSAAIPHLVKALKDPAPSVRRQAADSLGLLRASGVVAELGAILNLDRDIQVRQAAALALGAMPDKSAVPFLLKCLRDKSVSVVFPCVQTLGDLREDSAVRPLRRLLGNPSPDVKAAVITALGQIGSDEAYVALQSESGKKRTQAEEAASVEALGGFSRPDSLDKAKRALASPNEKVKVAACFALARLKDRSETAACSALLDSTDPGVRRSAARALGMMGDVSALPVIEEALKNERDEQVTQELKFSSEGLRIKARKQ